MCHFRLYYRCIYKCEIVEVLWKLIYTVSLVSKNIKRSFVQVWLAYVLFLPAYCRCYIE